MDLTDRLDPNGRLTWDVPEGDWTILRFGRTTTGANTRPAPQPGLGFECDKFDPAALDAHFDAFVGTLLRDLGPRPHRPQGGLDDAAHRQLGNGRAELERRSSARNSSDGAATIRCGTSLR